MKRVGEPTDHLFALIMCQLNVDSANLVSDHHVLKHHGVQPLFDIAHS